MDINDLKSKKVLIHSIFLICIILSWSNALDRTTTDFVDDSIKAAAVSYGAAKLSDGLISVINSIQVSAVFADVQIGAALNPIQDAINRYCSLMELSLTSLMIQKLLLTIFGHWFIKLIITVAGITYLIMDYTGIGIRYQKNAFKVMIYILGIRFLMIFSLVINEGISKVFLDDHLERDQSIITNMPNSFDELYDITATQQKQNEESLELLEDLETKEIRLKKEIESDEKRVLPLTDKIKTLDEQIDKIKSEMSVQDRMNVFNKNPKIEEIEQSKNKLNLEMTPITERININKKELKEVDSKRNDVKSDMEGGFWSKVGENYSKMKASMSIYAEKLSPRVIIKQMENYMMIMINYLALFLLKTLVLPLFFLFILTRWTSYLWNIDFDMKKYYDQRVNRKSIKDSVSGASSTNKE